MDSTTAERPRRRWARIIAGVVFTILVVLPALALVAAVVVLRNLDSPWLKQPIVSEVKAATGLQVDYQVAQVELLSGLKLGGLVVLTPAPFNTAAPELLRVGTLEAHWSPHALVTGPIRIERVVVRDVALALVADDSGATSLTGLAGPEAPEPPPVEAPVSASQQVANLLGAPLPVGNVDVSAVSLSYVRVQRGEVAERWSLGGLAARVEAKQHDGEWKVFANLGQAGAPLPLELRHEGAATPPALAELAFALSMEAGASAARAQVDLDVTQQTFDPRFSVRSLLHGAVAARFDVEKRHIAVELERTQLTDSAELEAQAVLPDAADEPPVVTRALADIELGRLLAAIPPEWRPFTLERGKVKLDAQDVTLSAMPQLGPRGRLGLDVDVAALRMTGEPVRLALGGGRVTLVATPDPRQGLSAQLTFGINGLDVGGPKALRIPKAHGEVKGHQLRPEPASPLQVAGNASLSGMVESLDLRTPDLRAQAERLGFQLSAPLAAAPPLALSANVPIGALHVSSPDGRTLLKGPVRVKLDASNAFPQLDEPQLSRGRAKLVLDVGDMQASLDATKDTDAVSYTLAARTPDLAAARPFIPDSVAARIPWRHLGVSLDSKGSVKALFSSAPRLEHRTELKLQRPAWDNVTASDVAVVMRSRGDAWRHQGDVDLRIEGLRAGEKDMGLQHQTLTLDLNRRKPAFRLGLTSHEGPKVMLDAAAAFDRKARALRIDVKGDIPPLGPLAPLLAMAQVPPELDAGRLAVGIELHGTLRGVLTGVTADGTPRLAPDPARTASFDGTAVVSARGLRWRQDALSLNVPALHWQLASRVEGPKRTVHSDLRVEKLTVGMSDRRLSFSELTSDTTASFTEGLEADDIELQQHLKLRALEQNPALPYPVQDVEATFSARRKPTGVIHVPQLQLTNAGTSTHLKVRGRLDLSEDRRRLGLRGELSQDMARLARPGMLEGSGKVTVDFRVGSPDLVVFRTVSNLLLQDLNLRLPEQGFEIEGMDGNVPLTENLEFSEGQLRLLSDIDVNPYPMLRFADQHPLLSRSGYVSAKRISTPLVAVAPLAGNLSIDQHVVSMTQLEMGVRGGRITGQWLLDWQGKHSTLEARVRATGVQSSRGEPFDGNAAVVISAKDRSINGRAEILRIGNRHLLDLLDIEDPRHVNPATNRVRYALRLGYPEHVRVSFNHGFGSLRITMGGLAKLLSIDEIRGIPMGPIVDQLIKSMTPPETTP
ncbi:AsmA family protein [Myxococcus xanthus]|uniref:AsmA family protein n=1 Tax=Myxococcus xanthus TaxID=34 RepID=UPI00191775F7|nr:AsmA family protein [Myxococcus xanthus]QQR41779.1 AsmA family protein [Myxococcus xanthus]